MSQVVTKVDENTFDLDISGKDLAIFYRVFAQEPKEAMRIAKIFDEEPLSFASISASLRKQILGSFDESEIKALHKLVAEVEAEALAALAEE